MLNHRNIFFLCVYDLECIYNIYPGGGKKTNKTHKPTNNNKHTEKPHKKHKTTKHPQRTEVSVI